MSGEYLSVDPRETFYASIKDFADKGIYETDEYKKALEEFDAENYLTVDDYLQKGVANVVSRIKLIRRLEDESQRMKLLKQRENSGIPAPWFNIMIDWMPEDDPLGVEKLRECRDYDYDKIISEMEHDVDSLQEAELKRHGQAMVRAEDIMIDYYQVKRLTAGV